MQQWKACTSMTNPPSRSPPQLSPSHLECKHPSLAYFVALISKVTSCSEAVEISTKRLSVVFFSFSMLQLPKDAFYPGGAYSTNLQLRLPTQESKHPCR